MCSRAVHYNRELRRGIVSEAGGRRRRDETRSRERADTYLPLESAVHREAAHARSGALIDTDTKRGGIPRRIRKLIAGKEKSRSQWGKASLAGYRRPR